MKKLLVGLLAVGSISSFATQTTCQINGMGDYKIISNITLNDCLDLAKERVRDIPINQVNMPNYEAVNYTFEELNTDNSDSEPGAKYMINGSLRKSQVQWQQR